MFNQFEIRAIPLSLRMCRQEAEAFLARFDLRLDRLDYYAGIYDGDTLLCAGGYEGNMIKCIASAPEARGLALTNQLISHLRSRMWEEGVRNVFIFTKPQNDEVFESLGFTLVGRAPHAILLESDPRGVARYCEALVKDRKPGESAAIVMNANPFTKGHRYLVETAAKKCDYLHLFVVQTERNRFPFEVRRRLVEEGVRDLTNVILHDGGPYIISNATFPSYFIKEASDLATTQSMLDADVFGRHIAPALNITTRFVGTEPLDPMTESYNQALLQVLPPLGIKVSVIERLTLDSAPISASRVRSLLDQVEIAKIRPLVPDSTYEYLKELYS